MNIPVDSTYQKTGLIPEFTFDTLVIGHANQLAHAATQEVLRNPGTSLNPLLIHGGQGLGKTHLAIALGNAYFQANFDARVWFSNAQCLYSLGQQKSHFSEVNRACQRNSIDLLLFSDIQCFSNKVRPQEEFFQACNALIQAKKQIVIDCDMRPSEIEGLDPRLVSLLAGGHTVWVELPDTDMRIAILKKKAESRGIDLTDGIALVIAQHMRWNVRELESTFNRIIAFSGLYRRELTLEMTKEALDEFDLDELRLQQEWRRNMGSMS